MNTNGSIPQVGFGLWKNTDEKECIQSVHDALAAGYRHFDTAQIYGNEQFLGQALKQSGVVREDIFITTKISITNFGHKRTLKSFDESLKNLQTDHVDLLLLHFPVSLLRGRSWKALEEIHKAGKAKAIGVSNYTVRHLEELLKECDIVPAINQVELHVFLQQPELLDYCKQKGIVVEAYSPLAHGNGLDDPVLQTLAKKHSKTVAQIMLRWCVQMGTVPLPKSTHQERIKQNITLFDFELDDKDMSAIKKLDRNYRTCWDPTLVP